MLMSGYGYWGRQQRRPEEVVPALVVIESMDAPKNTPAMVNHRDDVLRAPWVEHAQGPV